MTKRFSLLPILLLLVFSLPAYSQSRDKQIDYNQTYRYPLSVGFEAQFVSPFALFGTDYQGNFTAIDLSAVGRLPLPSLPILQPMARMGFAVTRAEYDAAPGEDGRSAYVVDTEGVRVIDIIIPAWLR